MIWADNSTRERKAFLWVLYQQYKTHSMYLEKSMLGSFYFSNIQMFHSFGFVQALAMYVYIVPVYLCPSVQVDGVCCAVKLVYNNSLN